MNSCSLKELERWDERIREIARNFGLDFFETEFEICDHNQMLGYLAYNGMPAHYPHWSFGKAFERQKTLYEHDLIGLPYEMVINSNPCLAYLMRDNSLLLQILTMAHVYAHNDFFKNNKTFEGSFPEYTMEMFKAHAERARAYSQDPSIGSAAMEEFLDASHALSLNTRRKFGTKKPTQEEQKEKLIRKSIPKKDEFSHLRPKEVPKEIDLTFFPLEPEDDILLFIRDNNPYLKKWQKDVLTIVYEETKYFLPQMETKIMNEGWASYWHCKILNALELPQGLHLEFLERHNQVIKIAPGRINPYRLGYEIFCDIEKRFKDKGKERIFMSREADRDESFLRQHLTKELMMELYLFSHKKDGKDRIIEDISDEEGWKEVKKAVIKNTGLNAVPIIKIHDANYKKERTLYLVHEYDERELELSYAKETIKHLFFLWGKRIILESRLEGKPVFLSYDGREDVKTTFQLLS